MQRNKHGKLTLSKGWIHGIMSGDKNAPPVLFLHGAKFQASDWETLGTLNLLADKGFLALAINLPGYGDSPEQGLPPQKILHEILTTKFFPNPVLVGPSMGGKIVLEFALEHQELLQGIVLVGSVGIEENLDKASSLKLPVLLVWGSEDTISPPDNGRMLYREVETAEFANIGGAGHPCYLEKPDMWHTELLSFLQRITPKETP